MFLLMTLFDVLYSVGSGMFLLMTLFDVLYSVGSGMFLSYY